MNAPAFEFRHVEKTFFQTRALADVSFPVQAHQVTGLVGENGAGKSTLMNVLGGVLQPDAGEMLLAGQRYAPQTPLDAAGQGIAVVHQELNLFANLSIAENLFLTELPSRRWLGIPRVDRRELRRRAADVLETVGLQVDPEHVRRAVVARGTAAGRDRPSGQCSAAGHRLRRTDVVARPGTNAAAVRHYQPAAEPMGWP